MAIKGISLKNITVFEKIDMKFNEGINILIGENGTGKTHLMKILYAISQERVHFCEMYKSRFKGIAEDTRIDEERIIKGFKDKKIELKSVFYNSSFILDYFSSNNNNYLNLIRNKQKSDNISQFEQEEEKELIENKISVELYGEVYEIKFHSSSIFNLYCSEEINKKNTKEFVYIPAKEVLSHAKGFISTYDEREIAFDKTWYDIIVKAQKGFLKKVDGPMQDCLDKISELIGGSVEVIGNQFYIRKKNGLDVEFNYEAEGLRKIGLLWTLIRNGSIKKGSVLFWDEPESNLNPKIIPVIVDILLIMKRAGVQVFFATHNYNFAKYFDLRREENDKIMFYSLFYDESKAVNYYNAQCFKDLEINSILEADEKMLSEVLADKWGETIV